MADLPIWDEGELGRNRASTGPPEGCIKAPASHEGNCARGHPTPAHQETAATGIAGDAANGGRRRESADGQDGTGRASGNGRESLVAYETRWAATRSLTRPGPSGTTTRSPAIRPCWQGAPRGGRLCHRGAFGPRQEPLHLLPLMSQFGGICTTLIIRAARFDS